MRYSETTTTREFVGRLDHGADWREEIESVARDEGIDAAWFTALGAVQDADLLYYDQDDLDYKTASFDEPLEVAACIGNVAHLDGEPFAHTHAVLSRRSGQAVAGHLDAATVWAGELHLRELDLDLERTNDPATDLDLFL